MIGLKIAGAMLFVICGISACTVLNRHASGSLAETDARIAAIRYIKNMVDMYALPIPKILERMRDEERGVRLLLACGYQKDRLPSDIYEMRENYSSYDSESGEIFASFLEEFGAGYREEQIKLCEHFLERFCLYREELAARLPIKKKTNTALCITGTLIPLILLI